MFSHLRVPLIQAPMAGGPTTPELVTSVCRAGGLGFLAGGYLTAEALGELIVQVRTGAQRFGVNIFVPEAVPAQPHDLEAYAGILAPACAELGIAAPAVPAGTDDDYAAKLASSKTPHRRMCPLPSGCPKPPSSPACAVAAAQWE